MNDSKQTRTAFVAGATGFTGQAMAKEPAAERFGLDLKLHVRPGSRARAALGGDPRVVEARLDDARGLAHAMDGADVVLQLIGTVRARFDDVTSYETVDYRTTLQLLEAAREVGAQHFVLLSSVGAGAGVGAYLAWKKRTEAAVRDAGLPWTIVRPGPFAGDEKNPGRPEMRNLQAFFQGLTDSPLGVAFAPLRPVPIGLLARVLLHVAAAGPDHRDVHHRVLGGASLFHLARTHGLMEPLG